MTTTTTTTSSPGSIPEGSIIITPAEVYRSVTMLTTSVDRLVVQNERSNEDRRLDRAAFDKLEGRVSALERKVWVFAGAAATLGGTLGSWLPSALGSG